MENQIRLQYGATRHGVTEGTPITVLHIGEEQTAVATGTTTEPDTVFLLPIGSKRTAADFFKHTPPTPGELENAIMAVEDEVTRLRAITAPDSALFTADAAIREIAIISGVPAQSESVLTIEAMEQTFERLAAVTLGRSAATVGIPANAAFAATLLILRELMHHLQFASVTIDLILLPSTSATGMSNGFVI